MATTEDRALARRAVAAGWLRQDQVERMLAECCESPAEAGPRSLGEALVERGMLTAAQVAGLRAGEPVPADAATLADAQLAGTLEMGAAGQPAPSSPEAATILDMASPGGRPAPAEEAIERSGVGLPAPARPGNALSALAAASRPSGPVPIPAVERSAVAGAAGDADAEAATLRDGAAGATVHPAVAPHGEAPATTGVLFGRYQIINEIARGAMGIVYRAWDPNLKRKVALKVMITADVPGSDMSRRFKREAMLAAKVHHPNIVQVYDVGDFEGKLYYTMELIEGDSLQGALKKMGRIPPRMALKICRDAARALHTAHEATLVHRDIKPANIMLTAREKHRGEAATSEDTQIVIGDRKTSSFRVLVADFGIAKDVTSQTLMTKVGAVVGTPAYMSPEQAGEPDKVGARSDIYSLGVVLYQILCGQTPFADPDPIRLLSRVITEDPPPLRKKAPELSPDLETIVMQALEKEPTRRYATAAAFADDMDRYLSGEMIHARPASFAYRAWRTLRRWRPVVVGAAAAVLLSLGLTGWFVVRPMLAARQARAVAEGHFQQAGASVDIAEKCLMTGRTSELAAHWNDAVAELDRALAADPAYAEAWSLRGRVRAATGRREDALRDLDEALRRDPRNLAARYTRAKILVGIASDLTAALAGRGRAARDEDVLARFRATADRARSDLDVVTMATSGAPPWMIRHARAADAFLQGAPDEAAGALDEVIAQNPFLDDALDLRGFCRRMQGRAEEALADFEAAVKVNPLNVAALHHRGLALAAVGRLDEAAASYAAALAIDPGFLRARVNLGVVRLEQGKPEAALAELDRAVAADPDGLHGVAARGRARLALGRAADAEADFTRTIDGDAEAIDAWVGRAIARRLLGNAAAAFADAEKALALDAGSVPALLEHALAAEALGRTDDALADYGRVLAIDPACLDALANRAMLHLKGDRKEEARTDLQEFLRAASPDHPRRAEAEEAVRRLLQ